MRHYLFVFIFVVYGVSALCQPRVNSGDRYKIVAQSQPITNPVGWCYSSYDEKWCGCYGICIGEYKRNSKTPRRLTANQMSGYGDDGIYSLYVSKVKADDRYFYLLYHIYWDGEYDYPTIEVGWHYYKSCSVWLITEDEYKKFSNLEVGVNTVLLYDYALASRYLTQDGKDYLKAGIGNIIVDAIKTNAPNKPNSMFIYKLYIKLEEDNKTIRFQLPTTNMLWEDALKINEENERKRAQDKWYFKSDIYKSDCVDFSTEYFEISKVQFDKLIFK